MDLNNKILEDSKVIKSIFEDEDIDVPTKIFSNFNITDNEIKIMNQFYSNEFDFTKDQLIQLINAFNILDNINLLGSIILYKIGKYEYDRRLNITEKYFNKITLKYKEKKIR